MGNDMSDLIPRELYDSFLCDIDDAIAGDPDDYFLCLARRLLLTLREKDAELQLVREELELRCNDESR